MSLKNASDLSKFGTRLRDLLNERELTPNQLAIDLIQQELVHVKSRGKDITRKEGNAVGAVEKKIRAHINGNDANKIQGEFVLAYCKYFDISADYLFCLTDIRTKNIDVRNTCDLTGLTEEAVLQLSYHGGDTRYWEWNSICWSRLITSSVYTSINRTIRSTQDQLMEKARAEAHIDVLKSKMKGRGGKELLSMQEDLQSYIEKASSCDATIAGIIYMISRDVSNVIESYYVTPASKMDLKSVYLDKAKTDIERIYH